MAVFRPECYPCASRKKGGLQDYVHWATTEGPIVINGIPVVVPVCDDEVLPAPRPMSPAEARAAAQAQLDEQFPDQAGATPDSGILKPLRGLVAATSTDPNELSKFRGGKRD